LRTEESTDRRRWCHYTLGRTVIMVIANGVIRRTDRFVGKGERKAVWFSSWASRLPRTARRGCASVGRRRNRRSLLLDAAFAARVQSALRDHPVDLGTRAGR